MRKATFQQFKQLYREKKSKYYKNKSWQNFENANVQIK